MNDDMKEKFEKEIFRMIINNSPKFKELLLFDVFYDQEIFCFPLD